MGPPGGASPSMVAPPFRQRFCVMTRPRRSMGTTHVQSWRGRSSPTVGQSPRPGATASPAAGPMLAAVGTARGFSPFASAMPTGTRPPRRRLRAQIQILDTWDVSGLAATGSHDIVVEEVFVPHAFVWRLGPHAPRSTHFKDALYRFTSDGLFSWPMAAVAMGIAEGAIDEITQVALHKTPRQVTGTLHEQPLSQIQLVQAVALLCSARAWLHEVITAVWGQ